MSKFTKIVTKISKLKKKNYPKKQNSKESSSQEQAQMARKVTQERLSLQSIT